MLTQEQQIRIIEDIRAIIPDSTKNKNERRHAIFMGVVLGIQSIDHALVPPYWLMNVMAGRTDRLFSK